MPSAQWPVLLTPEPQVEGTFFLILCCLPEAKAVNQIPRTGRHRGKGWLTCPSRPPSTVPKEVTCMGGNARLIRPGRDACDRQGGPRSAGDWMAQEEGEGRGSSLQGEVRGVGGETGQDTLQGRVRMLHEVR